MPKKKIKDFTIGEVKSFCKNHNCPQCPFETTICFCRRAICDVNEELEREVEVEENGL